MIAVLFADQKGIYADRGVDLWDEKRDARLYTGPWPVVAHPPCQLWGKFAPINFKRWGGEHNRPGNDQGCFAAALRSVRSCGGVLEHPAFSGAWARFDLRRPDKAGWKWDGQEGYVCEVYQSQYGHPALKRTWLYYVGLHPADLVWGPPTKALEYQCGHDSSRKTNKKVLHGKRASATPALFADLLLDLAKNAK